MNRFIMRAEPSYINNDEFIDIVAIAFGLYDPYLIKALLWMNDGNGTFIEDTSGRLPFIEDEYAISDIITLDIDNDDFQDIVFSCREVIIRDELGNPIDTLSGQNVCLRNTGDGFYVNETEQRLPEMDSHHTRDLAFADVDNDGVEGSYLPPDQKYVPPAGVPDPLLS